MIKGSDISPSKILPFNHNSYVPQNISTQTAKLTGLPNGLLLEHYYYYYYYYYYY